MFNNKSSNPFLSENRFLRQAQEIGNAEVMTVGSTMTKFGMLLFLLVAAAIFSWVSVSSGVNMRPYVIGSAIGGFLVAMIVSFNPKSAPYLAPLYALLEGVLVGGISAVFSFALRAANENLVTQAIFLTLSVAMAMFLLYRYKIIRVTDRLRSILLGAIVGIAVFYLLSFVLSLFGINSLINPGGILGIAISGVIVIVAAFSLLLDFDRIEMGAKQGAPKYMEWFAAFGLLVTIIWLYLEVLRLLARLNSNSRE